MTKTTQTLLKESRDLLRPVSDAPDLDAERLLLHVLNSSPDKGKLGGFSTSWLFAHGNKELSRDQRQTFENLVTERKTGKPLAYILGEAEFYGRPFYVNEDVLIPRPETENLIDAALVYLQNITSYKLPITFLIADIGTGSGIIAITLALELAARYSFIATDISEKALAIARKNAERHGVIDHIEFIQGDMLKPIAGRKINLIVSNPPYVPTQEIPSLDKGRLGGVSPDTHGLIFEPKIALDGGLDGQKYVEQIKNAGVPYVMETTGGKLLLT